MTLLALSRRKRPPEPDGFGEPVGQPTVPLAGGAIETGLRRTQCFPGGVGTGPDLAVVGRARL